MPVLVRKHFESRLLDFVLEILSAQLHQLLVSSACEVERRLLWKLTTFVVTRTVVLYRFGVPGYVSNENLIDRSAFRLIFTVKPDGRIDLLHLSLSPVLDY
jgi:hypothetical protein